MRKMKASLTLLVFGLLTCCQSNNEYFLRGQVSGEFNESKVYLVKLYTAQPQVDSADVRNGRFTFTGTIDYPELFALHNHRDSAFGYFPIYLEPGKLVVSIDPENWTWGSQIEGGKINEEYNLEFRSRNQSFVNLEEKFKERKLDADSTELVEIYKEIVNLTESNKEQDIQFIMSHPSSPISPYILAIHINSLSLDKVGLLLAGFSHDLHQTSIYLYIKETYDRRRKYEN